MNSDWEDLTSDCSRTYMFIGDFGNNACDRTNLHIYRTPYPSTVSGTTVTAEAINFTYLTGINFLLLDEFSCRRICSSQQSSLPVYKSRW
ncbi:MAG: hypothetical protein IPL69_20290 [Saprospiraceae bacterium]|nr:hypothetical protein [Candidatus Brachybacter algidus]